MKYFIDTEFLEGTQNRTIFGLPMLGLRWGKTDHLELYRKETKPTIDLISIGIVAEDGMEYYTISKDFNLKEAWNRYDLKEGDLRNMNGDKNSYKVYWLRENVLKPIFMELAKNRNTDYDFIGFITEKDFTYKNLKTLIVRYGKSNKQIAKEIESFTKKVKVEENEKGRFHIGTDNSEKTTKANIVWDKPEFYAYYADYDLVAFCWLFGKMMDLPNSFPMYCKDLKQIFDEKQIIISDITRPEPKFIGNLKQHPNYPKQENEHNAIADARWNKKLYEFLKNL
jgi:hypothetical protein